MGKNVGIAVAAIAVAAFIGGLGVATYIELKPELSKKAPKVKTADLTELVSSDSEAEPAEYYRFDMSNLYDGDPSGNMYIHFSQSSDSFTYLYANTEMGTGTYTVEGNEIVCTTSDTSSSDDTDTSSGLRFILDGDLLITETGICYGDVPTTDTFDATFYQKTNNTTVFYYIFNEDGTYTLRKTIDDDEDPTDTSVDGTYTRDGDYIYTTLHNEDKDTDVTSAPYLIYKNHLVVSFYQEITAEEYEEEYAANTAAAAAATNGSISEDSTEE